MTEETEVAVDLDAPAQAPTGQPLYKPCPCGKQPEAIIVECQERAKFGRVMGSCCAEWSVEFRNSYAADPQETQAKASKAWNEAPRATD